jgi:hypothetical protein
MPLVSLVRLRWAALLACASLSARAHAGQGPVSAHPPRAALEAALDTVVARTWPASRSAQRADSLPVIVCLTSWDAGRAAEPDAAQLARLTRPRIAVVPRRRCPPTFDRMYVVVDTQGRPAEPPAPAGYDPAALTVRRVAWDGPDRVLVEVAESAGTTSATHVCRVRHAGAGRWTPRCEPPRRALH